MRQHSLAIDPKPTKPILWPSPPRALKPTLPRKKENAIPTYVTLANFTEKGLQAVNETVKRSEAFIKTAADHGAKVREFLWTQGAYDMVCVIEAPDDEAMSALMLNALKVGNVTGQTLRAFPAAEMEKILAKVS